MHVSGQTPHDLPRKDCAVRNGMGDDTERVLFLHWIGDLAHALRYRWNVMGADAVQRRTKRMLGEV